MLFPYFTSADCVFHLLKNQTESKTELKQIKNSTCLAEAY